jgi:hypothetical protein
MCTDMCLGKILVVEHEADQHLWSRNSADWPVMQERLSHVQGRKPQDESYEIVNEMVTYVFLAILNGSSLLWDPKVNLVHLLVSYAEKESHQPLQALLFRMPSNRHRYPNTWLYRRYIQDVPQLA